MLQYSKLQPAERLQLIEGAVTGRVSNLSDTLNSTNLSLARINNLTTKCLII